MTLADLKRRLQPGVKLRLVKRTDTACNLKRTVRRAQTNAVTMTGESVPGGVESWVYFPKASGFKETDGGFDLTHYGNTIGYKWGWEDAA